MKSTSPKQIQVFCSELCRSNECTQSEVNILNREINGIMPNITIRYDKFVRDPENLPSRIFDLLQIAAFVFCADRLIHRGSRESINNGSWARNLKFHIPVIDIEFWQSIHIQKALSDALVFMTGDRQYSFNFQKTDLGHLANLEFKQTSFFSDESIQLSDSEDADILLFSGGLDSLAGTIERLNVFPDKKINCH